MADEQPYVLGTGDDELERLGLQSRLWADAAHRAFRRARIRIGHRVLDVGCGPGYAAFDLAHLVTRRGHVVAVDESQPFLEHLEQQIASRDLPQVTAKLGDVQNLDALLTDEQPFDAAYARWVLCFVADPRAVVDGIAHALRPGGRLIVHDYFNYDSMTVVPHSASHDKAVAATVVAWQKRGGDPNVVGQLPTMLAETGFHIEHFECHQRIARGDDSMYVWVDVWWHTFAPKLVDMGLMTQGECDTLLAELAERRGDPLAFIHCPPVYEVIAVRK